jgi:DNA helicase IV
VCAVEGGDDDPLEPERRHLRHARRCLERMRDAVRSLEAQGGDPVSTEYLRAELYRRAQALLDDPHTPLFFGRVDRADRSERFYVGRRHVRDTRGDPVVVDWRADISRAFYRASAADPMGMGLRRRFGFHAGELTSLEDEHLDRGEDRDPASSGILTAEIERPRFGPMRDIVATIQPDQDDLVRTELARTVCIQGAPGTGKTAVGLHRAAYLLYAFREQLRRGGVLVIGPNRSFLSYIGALLPALGELDVEQVAVHDLVAAPVRGDDDPDVVRLKGDGRMAVVLRHAVYAGVALPRDDLHVTTASRRWRIPRYQLVDLIDRERASDTAYDVVRSRLASLIAESVRRRMEAAGGAPDDRAVARMARSAEIRSFVDAHWPAVSATALVFRLLTDAAFLAASAKDLLSDDEQQALLFASPPKNVRAARWSLADAFLIDEVSGLVQRPAGYAHVVVDEAQDLSAMQCRAVARRCPTGSATVLGDIAQATAPGAVADWTRTLALIGKPAAHVVALTRGYRVPAEVLEFANRLLPALEVAVSPASSIRQHPGSLRVRRVDRPHAATVAAVEELLGLEGSIGVIATDHDLTAARRALTTHGVPLGTVEHGMQARVTLVPVTLSKGLEFDHVVVIEPAHVANELARGLNWLYVALTRAVTSLTVLHSGRLPGALEGGVAA